MPPRKSSRKHERRSRSKPVSSVSDLLTAGALSAALRNPLMALILIPVLLFAALLVPVVLVVMVQNALYLIHPVFGSLFIIGLFVVLIAVLIAKAGNVLGYDYSTRDGLAFLLMPLLLAISLAKGQLGRFELLPSQLAPGLRSKDGSGESGPFLLPMSATYWNEMDGYGGMFDIGSPPVPLKRNYSTLVLGEPGAGKTTTINLLLRQMDADPDEPVVVFDYKSEFDDPELYGGREVTVLSVTGGDVNWNVFRETENEGEYQEIAEKLVDVDKDQNRNEFFVEAARELMRGAMIHLDRENAHPTNRELVEFFDMTQEEIYEALKSHVDLRRVAEQVGGPNDRTGKDVLATVRPFVSKTFTGSFSDVGGFSVRNYVNDPRGRVLVIQAEISQFERTKPAIRFFVDWAIQHGLADPTRNSYFVLDEFQRVPNLRNIENLTGAGRAQHAQAILGLQGITQLEANYDEGLANAIVAGATQEILMRPGDRQSIKHIQRSIGSRIVEHEQEAPGFGEREIVQEEIQDFSERELRRFEPGETIINTPKGFVHGRVKRWEDLAAHERDRLTGSR